MNAISLFEKTNAKTNRNKGVKYMERKAKRALTAEIT
jgi:hypothetical protein